MFLLMNTAKSPEMEPRPLSAGELILIGRGEHCDVRLNDPTASRVHCRLLVRDGKVFLTDAGARWGTFVNGVRVSECELMPGDELTVGESVLKLSVESESQGTTLARHSELNRPPGLTIAPSAPSLLEPIDEKPCPLNFPVFPERSSPNKFSSRPSEILIADYPLHAADYISRNFAGVDIEELICHTPKGLLFRGVWNEQIVALKLLDPQLFRNDKNRARFLRAVETTQGMSHPHLVKLIDGGIVDCVPYAITEFIEGESAAEMIHRIGVAGTLDWRTTLRIAIDIASALEYLESQNVLHRNVTPQHILYSKQDKHAKLSDLLIVKALDETQPALTQPGEVLGEIAYASPEQLGSGQPIDHRSDIYQLGANLYALLTGRHPFEGANIPAIIDQVLNNQPVPPTRYHLSIPALFEGTLSTMLAKRPQDRFDSARTLGEALVRVQNYAR